MLVDWRFLLPSLHQPGDCDATSVYARGGCSGEASKADTDAGTLLSSDSLVSNLTTRPQIAKMLQNLANKPSYAKEQYMMTLNPFVENNKARINQFLNNLCEVGDFYDTLEVRAIGPLRIY